MFPGEVPDEEISLAGSKVILIDAVSLLLRAPWIGSGIVGPIFRCCCRTIKSRPPSLRGSFRIADED